MKVLASLLCVVGITGCTSHASPKEPLVSHRFVEFLRTAEQHAGEDKPYPSPDTKIPIAGSDFTIQSFKSTRVVGTAYDFATVPCVEREALAEELKRLGFKKQPIGLPNSHGNIYARDNFRLGPDNHRSINAEFSVQSNFRCLQFLYIDYSDSAT